MHILAEGLKVTVIGLVIVFFNLFILYLVMVAMKRIFYREKKPGDTVKDEVVKVQDESVNDTDDSDEIIAVITADVSCCLKKPAYNLKVRSYRQADQSSLIWNQAGRLEQIESRRIVK